MLTPDELILIAIIVGMLILIISNRLSADIVAILVLLGLAITGLVSSKDTLSGFSSSVVITLMGLFMITHALETTGVIYWIAQKINNIGGGSEVRLIVLFMSAGALLSLIMNNVAAGAVLLPAAVRVAQISKVRLSKLLIPMSFGTLVGGMATYLTTANIILSGLLQEHDLAGLNMLDFLPTGGLIVVIGIIFMLLVGRHLLPTRDSLSQNMTEMSLHETYELDERLWEVQVLPESALAVQPLSESKIGAQLGLTVLAIWRGRLAIIAPTSDEIIHANDYLLVLGRKERLNQLLEWHTVLTQSEPTNNHHHNYPIEFVETIIPPRSSALGYTLTELQFRTNFDLTVVALWRGGRHYRTDVGKMSLQVGDALLMIGEAQPIHVLADDPDYIVPTSGYTSLPLRPDKALWAVIITAITLFVAIVINFPLPQVMLGGAITLVMAGCLTMEEAYQAIEWRVIFLVAGLLPLSIAITETGLAERIGLVFVDMLNSAPPLVLIAGMFLLSTAVTQIIGGQVTGLVVGPIAINAALQAHISPQAMAVTVAIGCSTAFLTPIAHPVNILMMGPGNYQFSDFFKVGIGMTVVTLIGLLAGMALFWGIY